MQRSYTKYVGVDDTISSVLKNHNGTSLQNDAFEKDYVEFKRFLVENYEDFFIRPISEFTYSKKSSDVMKKKTALLNHVFVKYKMPDFLYNVFLNIRNYSKGVTGMHTMSIGKTKLNLLDMFIFLSSGESFHKKYGKHIFTKQQSHIFMTCRHKHFSVGEAVIYSLARSKSNEADALKIVKTKLSIFAHITDFRKSLVYYFSERCSSLKSNEIDDLIDYVNDVKLNNPTFELYGSGITIDRLMSLTKNWHYDLRRIKLIGNSTWEGHPINDCEYVFGKGYDRTVWNFNQIKTAKSLQQEGNAQHHCVLSYKNKCISGACSIWSLTKNGKRSLTIEINNNGDIVQMRRYANVDPKPFERDMVRRFAKDNNLKVAC